MGFIQESLFKYADIENKLLWNTFLDKNLIPKIWSTVSLNKKVSRNQLDRNFQFVFTRGNIELKSRYYLVECHLVLTNWQESFVFYQCFYIYYLFLLCQTFPTPSDKILSEEDTLIVNSSLLNLTMTRTWQIFTIQLLTTLMMMDRDICPDSRRQFSSKANLVVVAK